MNMNSLIMKNKTVVTITQPRKVSFYFIEPRTFYRLVSIINCMQRRFVGRREEGEHEFPLVRKAHIKETFCWVQKRCQMLGDLREWIPFDNAEVKVSVRNGWLITFLFVKHPSSEKMRGLELFKQKAVKSNNFISWY